MGGGPRFGNLGYRIGGRRPPWGGCGRGYPSHWGGMGGHPQENFQNINPYFLQSEALCDHFYDILKM